MYERFENVISLETDGTKSKRNPWNAYMNWINMIMASTYYFWFIDSAKINTIKEGKSHGIYWTSSCEAQLEPVISIPECYYFVGFRKVPHHQNMKLFHSFHNFIDKKNICSSSSFNDLKVLTRLSKF